MFKPIQLGKFVTFIVGLVIGGTIVTVAVLSIAAIFDANADTDTTSSATNTFSRDGVSSDTNDDLNASVAEFLDTIDTSIQPESRFARKASLYSILIKADDKLLVDFLDISQSLSNTVWRQDIQSAIFKRLTMINPDKALDLIPRLPIEQSPKLIESIFTELSFQSFDHAVEVGSRLEFPNREIALKAIVQARVDLPEKERIEIGLRFGYKKYVQRLMETREAIELIDQPSQAWKTLIGDGRDVRFRLDSLLDISRKWAIEDGISVLSEILDVEHGRLGSSALDLLLIRAICQVNPEEFFRQAVNDSSYRFLLTEIVSAWAETNPVAALATVSSLDDTVDSKLLSRVIVRTWSETNPSDLLEKRTVLPESMEIQAMSSAVVAIAKTDPRDAVRFLENLRNEGVNTWPLAVPLVHAWSENDPEATLDWVVSGSNDDHPQFGHMVELAISNLAPVDPERALELALNPPSSAWPTGLDRKVIREFARKDVDAAAKLLPRVSENSRVRAYIGVGFEYVEGGKPEQAIKLAQELSPSDRDKYYSSMFDTWTLTNPHQLLEAMEDIPSSNARALAARALIDRNEERHFFSEVQVKRVKAYLNAEDSE